MKNYVKFMEDKSILVEREKMASYAASLSIKSYSNKDQGSEIDRLKSQFKSKSTLNKDDSEDIDKKENIDEAADYVSLSNDKRQILEERLNFLQNLITNNYLQFKAFGEEALSFIEKMKSNIDKDIVVLDLIDQFNAILDQEEV
jgi:hypothetical protein